MAEVFGYERPDGAPAIRSLVNADFHADVPLMMFNYSSAAHNTLHAFPNAWTNALRMCRGIVFDHTGRLVAHPFPKFFNFNQHPEAMMDALEGYGEWTATVKQDGHLGIIFEYEGKLYLTTRGSFTSPSAVLGTKMLRHYERKRGWKRQFPTSRTLLVEIIDPATKVHVDYGDQSGFVLLAAYDRQSLVDANQDWMAMNASRLSITTAGVYAPSELTIGASAYAQLVELVELMKSRDVRNEEGFVIRFEDSTRVKVKFETYIQLMVLAKLSPTYIMNRIMAGNLHRMLSTLDEEVVSHAHELVGRIMRVLFITDETPKVQLKRRRQYLYGMVPPPDATPYFRGICNKLIRFLSSGWDAERASPDVVRS